MAYTPPPPAVPITVAYGDGIGPEILEAALTVLREAGAQLSIESIEVGQRLYDMEAPAGILPSAWDTLYRTGILLQSPVVEPEGQQPLHAALRHRMGIVDGYCEYLGDIAAEVHLGERFALFIPAHGIERELTGTDTANPAAMILSAALMLDHIGQKDTAARIKRALLATLESGQILGTREFAEAVIQQLWIK